MAPILEWIQAAIWANYKPDAEPGGFFDLEGDEQSIIVAAYRAVNRIEGVMADDADKKARRGGSSKKKPKTPRR